MKIRNNVNNVENNIRSILLDDGHFLFRLKKKSTSSTWSYINAKNSRGITLVALVITIIVLLILAGITINLTLGEHGIFKQAQRAKIETEIADYKEKIDLARIEVASKNLGEVTLDNLIQQIYDNKIVSEGKITKLDDEKAKLVTDEGYTFIITTDSTQYIEKDDISSGELPEEVSITLNKSATAINIGQTETLTATTKPENQTIIWSSSDSSVATVDGGVVTAQSVGTATITASIQNGEISAICTVTVRKPVTSISLDKTSISLEYRQTGIGLNATILPSDATNKSVTWSSSDSSVATVYPNGSIAPLGVGSATITAKANGGKDIEASCQVTVTPVNLSSVAKPGDLVKYDSGTDYKGLWVVLYNNDTYGLELMSWGIPEDITLGGTDFTTAKNSYNSAITILNNATSKYVNTDYATRGRSIGTNPLNPTSETTTNVTLQFQYNGSTNSGLREADSNSDTDENAMKTYVSGAQGSSMTGYNLEYSKNGYWIANRNIVNNSSYGRFIVKYWDSVSRSGELLALYNPNLNLDDEFKTATHGLRPVVKMKSDVKTNGGSGYLSNPWILTK